MPFLLDVAVVIKIVEILRLRREGEEQTECEQRGERAEKRFFQHGVLSLSLSL